MPNEHGNVTLDDLRIFLTLNQVRNLPGDTEIGIRDHYGNFHAMSQEPEVEVCKPAYGHGEKKVSIVFERIDVGPEPD